MKRIYFAAAILFVFSALNFQSCKRDENLKVVRIAVPPFYSSSLLFIAKDKNFFEQAGVNVKFDILPFGKDCIKKMLEEKYDLSTAYTSPLANHIKEGKKFSILTELHSSTNNTKLIYRKDLVNIESDQLENIKIGLVKETNAEFLLSLFLAVNSINLINNEILHRDLGQLETLLLDGSIQGAVFWQPFVSKLLSKHPDKLDAVETPFYTDFSALVANSSFVEKNQSEIDKIIIALIKAKKFYDSSPKKAHVIISKYIDDNSILENDDFYKDFSIELGLSQMFKVMLRSEINWNKRLFLKERYALDKEPLFRTEFLKRHLPEKVTMQ